jgi:hypothetical protein
MKLDLDLILNKNRIGPKGTQIEFPIQRSLYRSLLRNSFSKFVVLCCIVLYLYYAN